MSLLDPALLHDFPDRAFRRLLEDPHNLRDLLADAFPDLVARFDFEHMETVPAPSSSTTGGSASPTSSSGCRSPPNPRGNPQAPR